MDVWMIWAQDPSDENVLWLVDAWDDESISGNQDGWMAALAKAEEEHGSRFIRIAKTHVDYDAIVESFKPVVV